MPRSPSPSPKKSRAASEIPSPPPSLPPSDPPSKRQRPRKADYRQRAHCNPLSDSFISYPLTPEHVDWSLTYPQRYGKKGEEAERLFLNTSDFPVEYSDKKVPEDLRVHTPDFLDIGCGFGGLLVALAPHFKEKNILGLEIRDKVTMYVGERIRALRTEEEGVYEGIGVLRTNAMKFLPNYIKKKQCEKLFFCFPDPHFKKVNWRRRIINKPLMDTYAYVMKEGGLLYTVTDVEDLHVWMASTCAAHPLFEKVEEEDLRGDPALHCIQNDTEEGKKVKRNNQPCHVAVFRRKKDPQ